MTDISITHAPSDNVYPYKGGWVSLSARHEEHLSLYIIHNPSTKLTKIGTSTRPTMRLKTVESHCGQRCQLMFHVELPRSEALAEEKRLLAFFDVERTVGEWVTAAPSKVREQISFKGDFDETGTMVMDHTTPESHKKMIIDVLEKCEDERIYGFSNLQNLITEQYGVTIPMPSLLLLLQALKRSKIIDLRKHSAALTTRVYSG